MERFWEIDFSRGIALLMMVLFNYSFTLRFFGLLNIDSWDFNWLFPRIIAAAFIFISGISVSISYYRNPSPRRIAIRGAKIFGYGMIVTVVTWMLFPSYTIIFGILHLIGISIILSVPFLGKNVFLPAGAVFIAFGAYIEANNLGFSQFFWLVPNIFQTFDYFPLLPWFGVVLLGAGAGTRLFDKKGRKYNIRREPFVAKPITIIGRRSLLIYFLHQPVLLAILYIVGYTVL